MSHLFRNPRDRLSCNMTHMANGTDPDQTAPEDLLKEQSDLGLHCLPRTIMSENLGSI